jgi:hypothetical protein
MKNAELDIKQLKVFGTDIHLSSGEKLMFTCYAYDLKEAIERIAKDLDSDRYKRNDINSIGEIRLIKQSELSSLKEL